MDVVRSIIVRRALLAALLATLILAAVTAGAIGRF